MTHRDAFIARGTVVLLRVGIVVAVDHSNLNDDHLGAQKYYSAIHSIVRYVLFGCCNEIKL